MLRGSVGSSASSVFRFGSRLSCRSSCTHVHNFVKVFAGAGLGLFIALAIGAAFIAVWFTQASNLWAKSEALWEGQSRRARTTGTRAERSTGIFSLVASLIIMIMAVTMLKMDRARAKWRYKLLKAFEGKSK